MKPALVLVDLQHDFLRAAGLEPAVSRVIVRAAELLEACRRQGVPVVHVWTTVRRDDDRRMAHWKRAGTWRCVEGTAGHATPAPLRPRESEPVVHKTVFSPFGAPGLSRLLEELGADTLWVAGVHLHGCVRATALDAYQRGLSVCVADDAVASDDPLHAAVTRRYLAERGIRFVPVASLGAGTEAPAVPREVAVAACGRARDAWPRWRDTPVSERVGLLLGLARALEAGREPLALRIAVEIGKPLRYADGEVARSIALIEAAARRACEPLDGRAGPHSTFRRRPLGVIAAITPWNNPVAIPVGKIAPALAFGNVVVWKPSPLASSIAAALLEHLRSAGCPEGVVDLLGGDAAVAAGLLDAGGIDAVTFTGSATAGFAVQEACARRFLPLQAELGGNNGAIVCADADLQRAASRIAEGAFGFAGQRCTANRRVVVERSCRDEFLARLRAAIAALPCGDPLDPQTIVGPLVSRARHDEIAGVVARSRVLFAGPSADQPAFHPPVVVQGDDPEEEIVQRETFGPVLVVQTAEDFPHALALCNGVPQGLVAALFSRSAPNIERFLAGAQAGILKIDEATADADAEAPFGGWKASGIGPPEHGASNREFYTRAQAIYRPGPLA